MLCGGGGQDFNVKYPLLRLLQFLSDLKCSIIQINKLFCCWSRAESLFFDNVPVDKIGLKNERYLVYLCIFVCIK